jgi:hypothetical protein
MREPEMVGPESGAATSRGGHAVAGRYRKALIADGFVTYPDTRAKVGQAGCPMVAAQLVVGGIEAYRILGLTFDRRGALLARFL